ncbi:MAG: protein kinase [Acidobacteria bacterium]|nr:protein kinase [Acidobacteriota bacterium]
MLDFGIAKTLGEEPGATALTGTLNRVLTPEYASPEQVRGDEITTAGDVYSLGVVLYELLTGGLPYQFTTRSPQEVFRLVCEAEPVFPQRSTVRGFDSDLRNIILFALRKEPWRRYASVEKLSDDLRRYREHLPVAARADTIGYRARKFVQRNKLAAGAGILVFLSLVGGTAAIAWEAEVAREHARVANEGATSP